MFSNDDILVIKIKNKIQARFPQSNIEIRFDKELNEYFISTRNKELYYSDEYGMLIFEIDSEILWKQNKFNFYFVLNERYNGLNMLINKLSFSYKINDNYIDWNINKPNIFIERYNDTNNFSLAA